MAFPYADQKDYSTETIVGNTGDCLLVNAKGKRFVDESASRFDISAAIMEQTDSQAFLIRDATNCLVEDELGPFGADIGFLLANGQLHRANSIAKLAERMKMDPVALEETVEKYNGYAEKSVGEFVTERSSVASMCTGLYAARVIYGQA